MKKMNQVRQALNTCSPLEKIVKINDALGAGVSTISKKLYCESKNNKACQHQSKKDEGGKKPVCKQCDKFPTPKNSLADQCIAQNASDAPGCHPFHDNEPIRPIAPPDEPKQVATCSRQLKKMKDKACGGCKTGSGVIPLED